MYFHKNNKFWKRVYSKMNTTKENIKKKKNSNNDKIVSFSKNLNILYKKYYKKGYDIGYKIGLKDGMKNFSKIKLLENKYNESEKSINLLKKDFSKFLMNFKKSLIDFDDLVAKKILQISLKVSKIIINDFLSCNKKYILKKIGYYLKEMRYVLKNPCLKINPKNKISVIKTFGDELKLYGWLVITDNSIDINDCKITAKNGSIDATINSCWNQILISAKISKEN